MSVMQWPLESVIAAAAMKLNEPLFFVEAAYVLLSIVGQEFVSRRDWRGFYAWMVSNVFAAWLFFAGGRWLALLLSGYFFYKSAVGLNTWRRLERLENASKQGGPRE